MPACQTRPSYTPEEYRQHSRSSFLIFLLCASLFGVASHPPLALAQNARLKDFVLGLFGPEGPQIYCLPATTCSPPGPVPFPTTFGFFQPELQRLTDSLAPQLILPPFASPSTGFIFDVELGIPKRAREPLGPIVGEKAETLGQGRVNLAMTYSYLKYTRFQGQNLSGFQFTFQNPSIPETVDVLLDLRIIRHVLALSGTAGLTDDLDVAISLPYVMTSMEANAVATLHDNSQSSPRFRFPPGGPNDTRLVVSKNQDKDGIGDMRLLAKYVFLRDLEWVGNLGAAAEVKLPTGSAGDLTGTGSTQITGTLIASRDFGWLGPHLNVGFTYDTRYEQNTFLGTLFGFDARIIPRLTFASEVLWRYRTQVGRGANTVDFIAGFRWNPWRDLVVTASAQIPLNKSVGLRTDVTPSLTVEYTF